MSKNEACVEICKHDSLYHLIQLDEVGRSVGLLAVLQGTEYNDRVARAKRGEGFRALFDVSEQYSGLSTGEARALETYLLAGSLDDISEGESVIAYESLRDLPDELRQTALQAPQAA